MFLKKLKTIEKTQCPDSKPPSEASVNLPEGSTQKTLVLYNAYSMQKNLKCQKTWRKTMQEMRRALNDS